MGSGRLLRHTKGATQNRVHPLVHTQTVFKKLLEDLEGVSGEGGAVKPTRYMDSAQLGGFEKSRLANVKRVLGKRKFLNLEEKCWIALGQSLRASSNVW